MFILTNISQVPRVWEGVLQEPRPQNAHAHPQKGEILQVRRLQRTVQAAARVGTSPQNGPQPGEGAPVPILPQSVQALYASQQSPAHSHGRKGVSVQILREIFQAEGPSDNAREELLEGEEFRVFSLPLEVHH